MTSTITKTALLEAASVRYFREAATAGSIRRAAEALYVSPSALTRQIAQLENLIGRKLLERRARGVTPTTAGSVLLNYSQQSLFRIHEMIGALDDMQQLRTGHVSVASVEGVATSLLADCVVKYQEAYPQVSISLAVLSSQQVVEAVMSGEVEIGIAFEPKKLRELRFVRSIAQPLCAVVHHNHPLARRRSVQVAELLKFPLILPNTTFGLRQVFDRAMAAEGLEAVAAVETNSIAALKTLVKNSPNFLTILHKFVVASEIRRNELRAVPITHSLMESTREVLLVRKDKFLSQAALQFLTDLTQRMNALQGR